LAIGLVDNTKFDILGLFIMSIGKHLKKKISIFWGIDSNIWLSDQHLGSIMKILYVEKLQSLGYEQYTYAIIGK